MMPKRVRRVNLMIFKDFLMDWAAVKNSEDAVFGHNVENR
jgi:hypothetical protein